MQILTPSSALVAMDERTNEYPDTGEKIFHSCTSPSLLTSKWSYKGDVLCLGPSDLVNDFLWKRCLGETWELGPGRTRRSAPTRGPSGREGKEPRRPGESWGQGSL